MAKIKFGMMMTDARGKLGGQVFSKNRAGAYVRTKVTPANPRTSTQMLSRSILGLLSASWSGLSDVQRRAWNSAVNDWQKTDVFGDSRKPTGKNLFTGLNKELLQSGQSQLNLPPEKVVMPELAELVPVIDIANDTLSLGITTVPTDFVLQVSATPAMSQGTSFIDDKLRVIAYAPAGAIVPATLFTAYTDKFGIPEAGANVHVAVKLIAETGQTGVRVSAKATVTDD